ncbi:hypothetical protein Salat_1904100 [Sesamum alatum]|uniref:Uncharacterized protein n=1 Tax=Sesamum alatum TaxID=300844 RepID=A0AAE2CIA5_9LAMI|nr:hypothetical protein Salat_1904100 [Sesamum alatum]
MESDILQFDYVLSLTEDEAAGVVIRQAAWDKGSSAYRLAPVGRLLSHRTVLFDALKGFLVHLIQATRGMVVHKVSESRFCLVFSHQGDLRRRTLAVIQHIGDCVGSWLSEHDIAWDISFYETVCIRININVTRPLKRALRICSESGHISRFCDLRFDAQFSDPGLHTPYGAWLRVAGLSKHLGLKSDAIRPTYVWNSSSMSRSLNGSRRGANIFGVFSSACGGMSRASPEIGAASPSSPVTSERLGGLDGGFEQQQLNIEVGTLRFPKEMGQHGEGKGNEAGPNLTFHQDFMVGLSSTQPNMAQPSASNLWSGPSLSKPLLALIDESNSEHDTPECSSSPHFSGRRFFSPCSHQSQAPMSDSPQAVGGGEMSARWGLIQSWPSVGAVSWGLSGRAQFEGCSWS